MGHRKPKSRAEWEEELRYIQGVTPERDRTFNNDPKCFNRYIEMQAKFAAEDGCGDLAAAMRECQTSDPGMDDELVACPGR